ncbi:uncharacterized protein [Littorina saxatilis]|uniref:uncharacterized protein n=1 Tax=Littorina saxatilis TaxID=31220 RepID=UPI0038B6582F
MGGLPASGMSSRSRSSSKGNNVSSAPTKGSGLKKSHSSASDNVNTSVKGTQARSKDDISVSLDRGPRAAKCSEKQETSNKMIEAHFTPATYDVDGPICDNTSPSEKRKSDMILQHEKKRLRFTRVGEDSLDGDSRCQETASRRSGVLSSSQNIDSPGTRKRRHSSKSDTATPGKTKRHKDFVVMRRDEEKGQGAWLGNEHEG